MKKQTKILNLVIFSIVYFALLTTITINHPTTMSNSSINASPEISYFPLTRTQVVSSSMAGHSYRPTIALDLEENTHIVWADQSNYQSAGYDLDIFYRNRSVNSGEWGPIEVITLDETAPCSDPQLVADNQGTLHLVYHTQGTPYSVHYRYYSSGVWSSYEIVSSESTGNAYYPDLAVDNNRNVHVAWGDTTDYSGAGTDDDIFYKNRTAAGVWSTTEVVSTGSISGLSYPPSIECDVNGNPHIVWEDTEDITGASSLDGDIFYKNKTSSTGTWSSTVYVSVGSLLTSEYPKIDIDQTHSILHIAWCDRYDITGDSGVSDDDLFYRNYSLSSNIWSPVELVTWGSDTLSKDNAEIFSESMNLHIVYEENGQVYYKNREVEGNNWSERQHISSESTNCINPFAELAIPSSGLIQFVWADYSDLNSSGTDSDIFFREINILPSLNSPSDQNNLVTSTGNEIIWIPTDTYSLRSPNYTVIWNSSNYVTSGTWISGESINVNIDLYHTEVVEYNFTIIVDDGHGDLINDSVYVTLFNENPILSSPSDFSYEVGSIGNNITWVVTDTSIKIPSYSIYRNGTEQKTDSWTSGSDIEINVDNLELGEHIYTIEVLDGFGESVTDTVFVTVTAKKSISSGYAIFFIGIISILGLILYMKKKVKKFF